MANQVYKRCNKSNKVNLYFFFFLIHRTWFKLLYLFFVISVMCLVGFYGRFRCIFKANVSRGCDDFRFVHVRIVYSKSQHVSEYCTYSKNYCWSCCSKTTTQELLRSHIY